MKRRLPILSLGLIMLLTLMSPSISIAAEGVDPIGPVEASNLQLYSSKVDYEKTTINVDGSDIGAYLVWDEVDNYNENRGLEALFDDPGLIGKFSMDLYVPRDVAVATDDAYPTPVRFWVSPSATGSGTASMEYTSGNLTLAGSHTMQVLVGGEAYTRVSCEFIYKNSDNIRFSVRPIFWTDKPVYIANIVGVYPGGEVTHRINWITNGGAPAPAQTAVIDGGTIEEPAAMTRDGYTFAGWYENENLSGAAVAFPVTNVTGHKAYYAKWTRVMEPGLYKYTGNSLSGALLDTPLEAIPLTVTSDAAGDVVRENIDAYLVIEPYIASGSWRQNPFRLIPDPENGSINNIKAITLTGYMPATVQRNNAEGANVPHIRFDYTVRPIASSFAWALNSAGLLVDTWLIPQGAEPNEWVETNSFASGSYNGVPGAIPEGPRPIPDNNFNDKVYIDGRPYIRIEYTINFSELVSIEKEEIIFTFSIGNTSIQDRVYIADVRAVYNDSPYGGAVTGGEWPQVIYMNGQDSGISINDFTVLTTEAGLLSTSRGTWGGQQSRLTVTDEGVFVAYTSKLPGEIIGASDGYDNNDIRSFSLVMQPKGSKEWIGLGTWEHSAGPPICMSDAAGNVYITTYMSTVPWPRVDLRPTVIKYEAGSYSKGQAKLEEFVWTDDASTIGLGTTYYISGNISPDGKVYLVTSHNFYALENKSGYMDIVVFDTKAQNPANAWKAARLWTGIRYAYSYINFVKNQDGLGYDAEIIGLSDDRWNWMGYTNEPSFAYIFDGFTQWRISPEFPTDPNFIPARGKVNVPPDGYYSFPNSFELPNYAVVVKESVLVYSDPADYNVLPNMWPSIGANGTGDVFYDGNGDVHFLYSRSDISTNFSAQQYHMLIRDGEIVFDKQIFGSSRQLIMCKDSLGNYYILSAGGTATETWLHKAVSFDDSGWVFGEVGKFDLPLPVRYAGFSQAYIAGVSGHGDQIYVIYPIRGPLATTGNADEYAYFRLDLDVRKADVETDAEFLQARAAAILRNGLKTTNLILNNKVLTLMIDGREFVLSTNANNRNISGEIFLGDGYFLIFDIKGNGSNVKVFQIIRK